MKWRFRRALKGNVFAFWNMVVCRHLTGSVVHLFELHLDDERMKLIRMAILKRVTDRSASRSL